jgi:hypothetical protein
MFYGVQENTSTRELLRTLTSGKTREISVLGSYLPTSESNSKSLVGGRLDNFVRADSWLDLFDLDISYQRVGASILDTVVTDQSVRAFVFFSLNHEKLALLVNHLAAEPGLEVIFAGNYNFSKVGTLNLIELCYGDKPFFTERLRETMTRERFGMATEVFIVLYSLDNGSGDITRLKAALRSQLPALTFERRIHGTDGVVDTRYLVEAITNVNNLHLLNRVRLSRKDRVFTQFPDELRGENHICVDGSATMELYGLRKSRDLDLICIGQGLEVRILAMGLNVNNAHYTSLPFSHEAVIRDPFFHVQLYGIKFTSLAVRQMLMSFGPRSQNANWGAKKSRDMQAIAGYFLGRSDSTARWSGFVNTTMTQLRLFFEFLISRVVPRLPKSLVRVLRRIRSWLVRN